MSSEALEAAVKAKPIEWEHNTYPYSAQDWSDKRYGFVIELDRDEEEDYRYRAVWGEKTKHFGSLAEAQQWCQEQVDDWVREWFDIATIRAELERLDGWQPASNPPTTSREVVVITNYDDVFMLSYANQRWEKAARFNPGEKVTWWVEPPHD